MACINLRPLASLISVICVHVALAAKAQTDGPVGRRWLEVGFEQRIRSEWLTAPFRARNQGATRTLVTQTRLALEITDGVGPFRMGLELQDARDSLTDGLFFEPEDQVNQLDILQLGLGFSSQSFLGRDLQTELQIGRVTTDIGSRRLVARNVMRNTTNAFDGVIWQLGRPREWRFQGLVTRPVVIATTALDSSRLGGDFWGAYFEKPLFDQGQVDLYYFGFRSDDRAGPERHYSTTGTRFYRQPTVRRFDLDFEYMKQFGKYRNLLHRASFHHLQLGYTFAAAWEPRLSVHYDYASGDEAPDDGRSGQFDTLFGARAFEYSPTGIYGPLARANLKSTGLRLLTNPTRWVNLVAFYRTVWLEEARDLWVETGLQDLDGVSGNFVGHHIDTRVRLRPIHEMMVDVGYSRLLKSAYFESVPSSPGRSPSGYLFGSVVLRLSL